MPLLTFSSVVNGTSFMVVSGLFLAYCFLGCDAPKPKLKAAFVLSSACQSGVQVFKTEEQVEEAMDYVLAMADIRALSPDGFDDSIERLQILLDCMTPADTNVVVDIMKNEAKRRYRKEIKKGPPNDPTKNVRKALK